MSRSRTLSFGKHKGRLLDEVLLVDPDYFYWLQAQSDLLRQKPELQRAFAELGVAGDQTPLHNAVQALFLDDSICERVARYFWPNEANNVIRTELIRRRRERLINEALLETSPDDFKRHSRRTRLLRRCRELKTAMESLRRALRGSDQALAAAREEAFENASGPRRPGLANIWYDREKGDLRTKAEEQLKVGERQLERTRAELAALRRNLSAARIEADRLSSEQITVEFKLETRRMEAANGSDVRIRSMLLARAPVEFSSRDNVHWRQELWIEIKPFLSDDFPSLLRQLEVQRKAVGHPISSTYEEVQFVAVIGRFGARGASLAQVRRMFTEAGFGLVLLEEIGEKLPSPTCQALPGDSLPLFERIS